MVCLSQSVGVSKVSSLQVNEPSWCIGRFRLVGSTSALCAAFDSLPREPWPVDVLFTSLILPEEGYGARDFALQPRPGSGV